MKDRDKLVIIFIMCTGILIISLYCYSSLFIGSNMIQNNVKFDPLNVEYINSTHIFFYKNSTHFFVCTVESTDSWEDYLKQEPGFGVYTPPENYTDTAIVGVENNEKWIIIYDHDIPFSSIVIRGEIVYTGTISEYSGIIMVKDMPNYSWPHMILIKHRDITRFATFLIFIFWISLLYISLSEWSRRT